MKFTLSWLKQHLETSATLAAITDTLTRIGLELESVQDPGAALAAFRVAHVVEAIQHPNADRLRVCKVDIGAGALVSVVCGAPNARTGMKAVFAPPGSRIPSSDDILKVGQIRGVESAGMLLSLREMGLGDDHAGIVELAEDAPVGTPYPRWAGLDDPVIDISVTPNRGDALSVRGIARDLAAAGLGVLKPWAPAAIPAKFASPLRWAIEMPDACPWILGRAIRGVRNGKSPKWLSDRLTSIGLRPINALVDVTNFLTFDVGRPLHVFDIDKVSGGVMTLRPGAGEVFRALNGKDYSVTPDDCAIADAAGVQSLAGVMGGAATGCDDSTQSVFIECALFDPIRVALTGRRHQIVSDARQRFERGIDPALLPAGLEAATRLIIDICGGEASEVVSAGAEPAWQRTATLRFARLGGLGGLDVPAGEAVASLEKLGFSVASRDAARVTVNVPSWRNDIAARTELDLAPSLQRDRAEAVATGRAAIEPEADLVEEVLRLKGLDNVPPVSMTVAGPVPRATHSARQNRKALARRTLAAQGLVECVTFSFMADKEAALFATPDPGLRLVNPIAADLGQLRPTPVATLALAAKRNADRGFPDVALFEIGPAFQGVAPESQPMIAAGVRSGGTPRHWKEPSRAVDVMDAKGDALAVLAALGVPMEALTTSTDAPAFYHPGQSGVIRQGPKVVLATFGALHPRVLAGFDSSVPVVAFEVFLNAIAEPKRRRKGLPDLPPFMPVRRDFAVVVDQSVSAEAVLRAARGAERQLVASATLFDLYEGDQVEAGKKSLGFEVVFQPRDRTLTDAEIEAACTKVAAAVEKATGARLR